jgi:hypothetical protein
MGFLLVCVGEASVRVARTPTCLCVSRRRMPAASTGVAAGSFVFGSAWKILEKEISAPVRIGEVVGSVKVSRIMTAAETLTKKSFSRRKENMVSRTKTGVRALVNTLTVCGLMGIGTAAFATGNVSARLESNQLYVEGDGVSNELRVTQNFNGVITLTGLNGTTVNGRPALTYVAPSLIAASFKMNAGNDLLQIGGLRTRVDLNIELNEGNDTLHLQNVTAGANVNIQGGTGDESVTANSLQAGSDLGINLDEGVGNIILDGLSVGLTLFAITKDRNDTIRISNARVGADSSIETGSGADNVSLSYIHLIGTLAVKTEAGADRVSIADVTMSDDADINLGIDSDVLNMARVTARKNIAVALDYGNDTLNANGVRAWYDLVFDGGDLFDTLNGANSVTGGTKREIKGFERINP